MRVIGLGNADRGDDAAGLLVARRLREFGVDTREIGDPLSLIDTWQGADGVVVVDAVVTGGKAGEIRCWDAHTLPEEAHGLRSSTHGFTAGDVFRLARNIGAAPANVIVFGIEGAQFDAGTPPSRAVLDGVSRLVALLRYSPVISCSTANHES